MGWWSADILGGDTPLDMMWAFEDYFGLDRGALYPLEAWTGHTRSKVKFFIETDREGFWEKAVGKAEHMAGFEGEEVATQVAAVIWLNSGAHMEQAAKNSLIKAAQNDAWANEGDEFDNQERKQVMADLIAHITAYDGTPTNIYSKGLMEVLDKRINSNCLSWSTPKDAIKDLLHGVNKDAQKVLFKELLQELEES
jgi:hypothetical protein